MQENEELQARLAKLEREKAGGAAIPSPLYWTGELSP